MKVINSIGELLKYGYSILKNAGIDSYALDSELLLQKVIRKDRFFILLNRTLEVSEEDVKEYYNLINLRKEKMPVKYILGECEFMGLPFYIKKGVLIPRPDTETLVEDAIDEIKKYSYETICDVCCGSGAIGISIAKLVEKILVSCCDISDTAVEVTERNIESFSLQNRVKIFKSDLLQIFIDRNLKFDVIVSNPPYIREDVIPTLMEDVKNYEPYEALSGGQDGLYFYRKIVDQSLQLLNKGGMLAFEIGHDQREAVSTMLMESGFSDVVCIKDLAGMDRVVKAKLLY